MRRAILLTALLALLSLTTQAFAISNEEIRSILDKKTATVGDALLMMVSIDKPDADKKDIRIKDNKRLSALKDSAALSAGDFAVIAIEMKKADGGLIYMLTGWSRYASDSLVYNKIYPSTFSWNRELSGTELVEFISALKAKQDAKKEIKK